MSDRPQTTRNKIMCIMNTDNAQIMFLDTPGIHKPQHKLGQYMVRAAESTLHEVDVVLFVVDVSEKRGAGEDYILEQLRKVKTPVILVANKIDKLADKGKLFGIIESYTKDFTFAIIAAEMIREKVLRSTRDEVPHSIAVEIDEFKVRDNDDIYIRANIFVERESQKGIVIGAKGSLLKKIGEQARKDIESLLGNKVFLDLWVKVKPDWRNKDKALKQFGYEG